ncbi:unnamed protein product [Brachionus calyciflorus]|uniref:Uncharacterized protein n=1 Tax=Brachionus calyciflorus TaxID=104777 RepID=A0A813UEF9_9BILA|nr:unnamed protein product [Brachionus calyciflorus]
MILCFLCLYLIVLFNSIDRAFQCQMKECEWPSLEEKLSQRVLCLDGEHRNYFPIRFNECFNQPETHPKTLMLENFALIHNFSYDNFLNNVDSFILIYTQSQDMPDISKFKLTYVFINRNYITTLNTSYLPNTLEHINLSRNRITNIFGSFDSFKNLKTLDLSINKLKQLDLIKFNSNNLILINLSDNYLMHLGPIQFENDIANPLYMINIDKNKLTKLPIVTGNLKYIENFKIGMQQTRELFKNKLIMTYPNESIVVNRALIDMNMFDRPSLELACWLRAKQSHLNGFIIENFDVKSNLTQMIIRKYLMNENYILKKGIKISNDKYYKIVMIGFKDYVIGGYLHHDLHKCDENLGLETTHSSLLTTKILQKNENITNDTFTDLVENAATTTTAIIITEKEKTTATTTTEIIITEKEKTTATTTTEIIITEKEKTTATTTTETIQVETTKIEVTENANLNATNSGLVNLENEETNDKAIWSVIVLCSIILIILGVVIFMHFGKIRRLATRFIDLIRNRFGNSNARRQ